MKTVALISGGKDSCYNMMQCVAAGHTIVALANLQPIHKDELDSYMYQTVGHQGIELYAEAMELPLYREKITGTSLDQGRIYKPTLNDEVEDLFRLLSKVKKELDIEAVSCGAILSDYQRIRVENVCQRLGLVSLVYLWRRNQKELLQEMITSGVDAIIIKVAALGLDPRIHLGMTIKDIQPHLLVMKEKYGLNVCGEGGEYETFTLNCPLFRKKLVIDDKELIMHSEDPVASVGYLNLKLHVEQKPDFDNTIQLPPTTKTSLDFVKDLNDTVFSDISDIDNSESEIECIEKLAKEEKLKQNELNPLLTNSSEDKNSQINTALMDGEDEDDTTEEDYNDVDIDQNSLGPVLDHRSIYGNKHGWYFVGGIVGEGLDIAVATQDAMNKLISLLESEGLELPHVCSVNIYMRDMAEYSVLNEIYVKTFSFPNPPTRVCVQCPLPKDIGLIFDAVAYKPPVNEVQDSDNTSSKERVTMHVQGISHWAPANIGPYSQAVKVGEVVGTCGQIALVPGSMQLLEGGTRRQCALALRHLTRVLRASHPRAHIRSVMQGVCYVTGRAGARAARRALERRAAGAMLQAARVSALPRAASLEWHAWAHSDNDRFDYEETGCNILDYKVAITRRWNYENTVAAIICNVSTGCSPSAWGARFADESERARHAARAAQAGAALAPILQYALGKLLPPPAAPPAAPPVVALRLFYQAGSARGVGASALSAAAVAGAEAGARVALTAVPVLALHNAHTCLSIGGLRLDE